MAPSAPPLNPPMFVALEVQIEINVLGRFKRTSCYGAILHRSRLSRYDMSQHPVVKLSTTQPAY